MIPRHHSILFVLLLLASVAMGGMLWQLRQRAHQHLLAGEDSAPTPAPAVTPAREATLMVASDADGSLQTQVFTLPLPQDPGARGRAIMGKLLVLYATPGAAHPVPGGAQSVLQVFLLPAEALYSTEAAKTPASAKGPAPAAGPGKNPAAGKTSAFDAPKAAGATPAAGAANHSSVAGAPVGSVAPAASAAAEPADSAKPESDPGLTGPPQLAVVNLSGAFANNHPSGLEAETLTILSLCATLHANLPRVTQIRFLVDGQTRPTLAGHADLTRTWLTTETSNPASQP